jgi:hypothetical protein
MFFHPFAFKTEIATIAPPADNFPTALNAGLIGRWEVTNASSWPGSGSTLTNLSTVSQYSGLSAIAYNYASIDTTDGVLWTGAGTNQGVTFGITGSNSDGSTGINDPIVTSKAFTVATICNVNTSSPASTNLLNSWTDFGGEQNIYLPPENGLLAVRTNSSYNFSTGLSTWLTRDTVKFYGGRVAIATANNLWKGTSQFGSYSIAGSTFGITEAQARKAAWVFGTNATTATPWALNRNNFKGKWYASYIWNRVLSDTEMSDLQSYTNTYVKANS